MADPNNDTGNEYYLGIMTGTSLDGVDIALISLTPDNGIDDLTLVHSRAFHLPESLTDSLAELSQPDFQPASLIQIKSLEQAYTLAIADCVNAFVRHLNWSQPIKAIGCHGLTICHHPNSSPTEGLEQGFSWQLLDGSLLAAKTKLDVVYDFRSKDVALEGQGAPLVPPFHQQLFQSIKAPEGGRVICLNLGGIANLSYWDKNGCYGFDTGPANTLMDQWTQLYLQQHYDADGQWAAQGNMCGELLEHLLNDPYFKKPAPKSTGKEVFNLDWLKQKLANYSDKSKQSCGKMKPVDVQATLLHLTVRTIAEQVERISPSGILICCGGGVRNSQLMASLAQYLPEYEVKASNDFGISSDDMEAMAFAWLAYCRINEMSAGKASVTKASRDSVLGAWVSAK